MAKIEEKFLLEVFSFIKGFYEEKGFCPSIREIADGMGIKSTASVYAYINRLIDMGYLDREKGKSRNLIIKYEHKDSIDKLLEVIRHCKNMINCNGCEWWLDNDDKALVPYGDIYVECLAPKRGECLYNLISPENFDKDIKIKRSRK